MFAVVSCGQRKRLVVPANMAVAATGHLCPRRQYLVYNLRAHTGGGTEGAFASTFTHFSFTVSEKGESWLDEYHMSTEEMLAFAVGSSERRR